jgi:hypothetical protein
MRGRLTPLTPVATFFTAVSLSWTGYSVTDLIHSGTWGLLAAVSVDGLWAVVQYLEYKGIGGRTTKALGWAALAGACTLLGYHAWSINWGAVIASVLPPVVAKIAWIGDIRLRHNPAALTPEEVAALARMERGMVFEEREHDIRMRQQRMRAELLVSEVSTDFDIEVMRQDRVRDLQRRAPLSLTAGPAAQPTEPVEPPAQRPSEPPEPASSAPTFVLGSSQAAAPEPLAQPAEPGGRSFGFSAHLTAQSAQRAKAVAQVAQLLAQDSGITSSQVAEELAVSLATAKRYLREARSPKPATPPTGSQP